MITIYKNELEAQQAGVRVVAIDFDGTLVEYDEWNNGEIGELRWGEIVNLIREKREGSYVVIFTCRLNERLWGKAVAIKERNRIQSWLVKNDLQRCVDDVVGDKPVADEYRDDRGVPIL